jgi:branched-chain amino acid transport system ATP-binding protein
MPAAAAPPLLEIDDIEVVYEHIILALHGVSLAVPERSIVALLGANGAGKTTTLKAASRLLEAERGALTRGAIRYRGEATESLGPDALVRAGLVQVLEGRRLFPHLSVEENLIAGALVRRPSRQKLRAELDRIYGYFPVLGPLRRRVAGLASGGEQQMVAIGRALMARPRLVLLDEPSMGLAPRIVHDIFEIICALRDRDGVSFLLAEQSAHLALRYADLGHVLENGRVVASGTAAELRARGDVAALYLGAGRRVAPHPSIPDEVSP